MERHESFINRKRPAIEGLVEDLLGPASQLDELISGNPLPNKSQTEHENGEESLPKSQKEPR